MLIHVHNYLFKCNNIIYIEQNIIQVIGTETIVHKAEINKDKLKYILFFQ